MPELKTGKKGFFAWVGGRATFVAPHCARARVNSSRVGMGGRTVGAWGGERTPHTHEFSTVKAGCIAL